MIFHRKLKLYSKMRPYITMTKFDAEITLFRVDYSLVGEKIGFVTLFKNIILQAITH